MVCEEVAEEVIEAEADFETEGVVVVPEVSFGLLPISEVPGSPPVPTGALCRRRRA